MNKLYYSREEMEDLNTKLLKKRGCEIEDIAQIAFVQQSKYNHNVKIKDCIESVKKILSLRDVFHLLQLGAEIDRLTEEKKFEGPIQYIMEKDLGLFGVDEIFGLDIARLYGAIGQTNFGDIDVNKPGIVAKLNNEGKLGKKCHTFLDDIVGAIAAAAASRVAQILSEESAKENPHVEKIKLDI